MRFLKNEWNETRKNFENKARALPFLILGNPSEPFYWKKQGLRDLYVSLVRILTSCISFKDLLAVDLFGSKAKSERGEQRRHEKTYSLSQKQL